MKNPTAIKRLFSNPALLGAAVTVFCGLLLWSPLGDPWADASYDYLFRFGSRAITNQVVLVLMDDDSYDHLHQTRGSPWDRALHAQLLNKLADDQVPLVVLDIYLKTKKNPATDQALASAMHRNNRVVLMADVIDPKLPRIDSANVDPPE